MRTRAWQAIEDHKRQLQDIFPNYSSCGFVIHHDYWFNANAMSYDIETSVFRGQDKDYIISHNGHAIMRHREDYMVFPSEHLMTKLLLMVG